MTNEVAYGIIVAGFFGLIAGASIIWLRQNDQDLSRLVREIRYLVPAMEDLAETVDKNTAAVERLATILEEADKHVREAASELTSFSCKQESHEHCAVSYCECSCHVSVSESVPSNAGNA